MKEKDLAALPHFKAEIVRFDDGRLALRERDGVMSISMIGAEAPFGDLQYYDEPIPCEVYIKVNKR